MARNVTPENDASADKVTLSSFNASDAFITLVDAYQTEAKITRAELGRRAVAALVGYNLANEPVVTRRSSLSGLTAEEKLARQKALGKLKRDSEHAALELFMKGDHDAAVAALDAYLKRRQGY